MQNLTYLLNFTILNTHLAWVAIS